MAAAAGQATPSEGRSGGIETRPNRRADQTGTTAPAVGHDRSRVRRPRRGGPAAARRKAGRHEESPRGIRLGVAPPEVPAGTQNGDVPEIDDVEEDGVQITRYPGAGQGREPERIQPWESSRDRAAAEPGGMQDRVTRARRGSRGRLWPDARQTLLLRAGLLPAPAAIEAWQRIGPGLDVSTLDRGSRRLLPLVWSHLRRHGVDVDHLAEHYRSARAANERLLAQLGELLPALDREGIPTILLKGPALVVSAYPDVGVRPMSDVDVLVPIERVADATRALQERGWVPQSPLTAVGVRLTHSLLFRHPQRVPVDLHWHVFEECCRPEDDDGLWAASVPVTIGTASTRVPAPEDQLLHVCVHGEKWVHVPGIRWIADAVTIIRHGRVHWERLVAEAVRRRFVLRMSAQLDYLRSVFDPPIPPEVMTMLAAAPVSRLERFEWRWGVRDQRRPWLLVFWCNHVRSAPGGLATTVLTFPQYLQATWHLESLAQIPGAAAARVLRDARRRLRPRQA